MIGRIPYSAVLHLYKAALERENVKVWARNSYVLGGLRPFRSDLDLTFYFEESPTQTHFEKIARRHLGLQRVAPLVREINVYAKNEALSFLKFANFYEFARDPVLVQKLGEPSKQYLSVDAAVFLLRMMESNAAGLFANSSRCETKFENYFKMVGRLPVRPFTFLGLVREVVKIAEIAEVKSDEAVESLSRYLSALGDGKTPDQVGLNVFLWAFYPNRFCYRELGLTALDPPLSEIYCGQTRWEVWGLMSQYRFFLRGPAEGYLNKKGLLNHLRHLKKNLDGARPHIGLEHHNSLYEGLTRLERLLG